MSTAKNRGKLIKALVLVIILVSGLIAGAVYAVNKKIFSGDATELERVNAPKEHAVVVESPEKYGRVRKRRYPGIVNASGESALSFRISGPLVEVNVQQGRDVKQGDLLMQIDPRDFKDRIKSLEAQLSGVVALQKKAVQDYARISRLFKEEVLPQSDFDSATSAQDAADAAVKRLEAELLIARHALADTSLYAPYDGTVTAQLVENHEMVHAGQVVLKFHNIQLLEINVSVPENEIFSRSLNVGTHGTVSFPAVRGKTCDAHLTEWSSTADPLTRTYEVTFQFNAPKDYRVLPGMSADISWQAAAGGSAQLTVPVSALIRKPDGSTAVWLYDETVGRASLRSVVIGELVGASRIVVTDGLSVTDQVIVSGSRLIDESLVLKVVKAH